MIVTRDFISDNFNFTDLRSTEKIAYNKEDLLVKVDYWKYFLKKGHNAKQGESILIGLQKIDINYFAIIIAAAELSLKIVVVDYNRTDDFKNLEYNDPKTKLLSPIDIFLHDFPIEEIDSNQGIYAKFIFFTKHSKKTISTTDTFHMKVDVEELKIISDIRPNPKDILFRVTSSGTTDIPKVIEHTHEFIFAISTRNSKMYKGTALHTGNLNHGASASVTLLPLLTSDNVDKHIFSDADASSMERLVDDIEPYSKNLGYASFPYPFLIDKFIEISKSKNIMYPKLDLITLSYILESGKRAVRDGVFNSITSIFGSNETLGPLFLNTATRDNWNIDSRYFLEYDNFYKTRLSSDGKITISMPIYNKEIVTNDYFSKNGLYFIHQGRSDMFRINGESINLSTINDLNKKNTDFYVVIDTLNHCLYLACWRETSLEEIEQIKNEVESKFERVKITKISQIDKSNFYYGIKIDNELLREYFRTRNVS